MGRIRAHNAMVRVFRRLAIEAGLEAIAEPPTDALLMRQFSPDFLRSLLPKRSTAATNKLIMEVLRRIAEVGDEGIPIELQLQAIDEVSKASARTM